ncbi:MAG: hypothetical protein ACHQ4J_00920 [Candidatus Binatia bacterium]
MSSARGRRITDEEWHTVHRLFSRPRVILTIEPYPSIQTILGRLSERYELHFATSRLPEARKATVEWLEEQCFPPHRLHFLIRREKHSSLGKFHAAVEDDSVQALAFAGGGVRSFVLAHPWNREVTPGPLIERIRDWKTLERTLMGRAPRGRR